MQKNINIRVDEETKKSIIRKLFRLLFEWIEKVTSFTQIQSMNLLDLLELYFILFVSR
jgi:hypothetical protein